MGRLEEILLLVLVVLLLFGAKRIPELARSIGQSINEVKKGIAGESEDDKKVKKS